MQAWQHLRFERVSKRGTSMGWGYPRAQLIDCGSPDAELAIEDGQQVLLLNTHDHKQGLRAFTERRAPEYRNV